MLRPSPTTIAYNDLPTLLSNLSVFWMETCPKNLYLNVINKVYDRWHSLIVTGYNIGFLCRHILIMLYRHCTWVLRKVKTNFAMHRINALDFVRNTAWKVSKCGVFPGPYFPVYSRMRENTYQKNSEYGYFSRSVLVIRKFEIILLGTCTTSKVSKYGVFLVRIFLHSFRIQENTDQKKPSNTDNFYAVSSKLDVLRSKSA